MRTIAILAMAPVFCVRLPAQMLVVDRAPAAAPGMRIARTGTPGFIGDHFQIGKRGEVWIIDAIRTWAAAEENSSPPLRPLTDIFEQVTLFGGIEAAPPDPGQPPQPECDCHNLMAIKTAGLRSGASDIRLTSGSGGSWQVDFQNLHWSVPGGVPIQFGVLGAAPGGRRPWYNQASRSDGGHQLKAFDENGKLEGPYTTRAVLLDDRVGLNVQVSAHKMAPVAVRPAGPSLEVVLKTEASFDAAKADVATFRFGPKNAKPVATRVEEIEGRSAVVATFRREDTGTQGAVSACLTGRQTDGVPFEGCDLLQRQ
jgi:hypothetical protein